MPKGPRGEKRPADVIGGAVKVARIATGEIEDERHQVPARRKSGMAGARARKAKLSDERRAEIAAHAAESRWDEERRRVMKEADQCATLADRFERMAAEGLVDVKFFLRNLDEAASEMVCKEVNRLYEALENKEAVPLNFKDTYS